MKTTIVISMLAILCGCAINPDPRQRLLSHAVTAWQTADGKIMLKSTDEAKTIKIKGEPSPHRAMAWQDDSLLQPYNPKRCNNGL